VAETISKINLSRSHKIALAWLPPGDYAIPKTCFIYDGYGDAFALRDGVDFDIYSLVVRQVPEEERFLAHDSTTVDEIEKTLAHEYHHVYARRYLLKNWDSTASSEKQWIDYFLYQIVAEGVAMQCNPSSGFKRQILEDTATVAYYIARLNEKFSGLKNGTISGDEINKWYQANSDQTARQLLKDYIERKFPPDKRDELFRRHMIDRPIFEYVIGWWMITRILQMPGGKDKVMAILSSPEKILEYYNASLPPDAGEMRVKFYY
jgi:hypothetical protein